jgi:hypothetical protein
VEGEDYTLDRLLELADEILVVHGDGYWVKFDVKVVEKTPERPHGLSYSLTLHGPNNERVLGFDNAHPVPPAGRGDPQDHEHRDSRTTRKYEYKRAEDLLRDFWIAVDGALERRGLK